MIRMLFFLIGFLIVVMDVFSVIGIEYRWLGSDRFCVVSCFLWL